MGRLDEHGIHGIHAIALALSKHYLSERYQFVSLVNYHSSLSLSECGVPQGSILGPIPFLLCINDHPKVSSISKFHLFADDTNILHIVPDPNYAIYTINKEMPIITDWLKSNKLHLDINRSSAIIFLPHHKNNKLTNKLLLARIRDINVSQLLGVQSGFCAGRSTVEQTMALRYILDMRRVSKRMTNIIFVEFNKAFDSIDQRAIAIVLSKHGVSELLIANVMQFYIGTSAVVTTEHGNAEKF